MTMENSHRELVTTHAVYHRILQPAYERMIIQNVYRNKIALKSGASGQLLHKRPKTTGYLRKSLDGTSYPASSTYWNSSTNDFFNWQKSIGPSLAPSAGYLQDGRSSIHHIYADEFNIKSSTRANSFSATTRVREVPVSSIYKKEIQEFRTRTPSARGVRATALTNRYIIGSHTNQSSTGKLMQHINSQSSRWRREHSQLEMTRERKKCSQVLSHRVDRMYYMLGSSSKIHRKYDVTEDDLDKLRAIAISRGMKVPPYTYSSQRPTSTIGPYSTPREIENEENILLRQESAKTIIPTGETIFGIGDQSIIESNGIHGKEDRATSDHESDDQQFTEDNCSLKPTQLTHNKDLSDQSDRHSIKSDSAILRSDTEGRSVTFITENNDNKTFK